MVRATCSLWVLSIRILTNLLRSRQRLGGGLRLPHDRDHARRGVHVSPDLTGLSQSGVAGRAARAVAAALASPIAGPQFYDDLSLLLRLLVRSYARRWRAGAAEPALACVLLAASPKEQPKTQSVRNAAQPQNRSQLSNFST